MRMLLLLLLGCFSTTTLAAIPQRCPPVEERPCIGLVLGGGGARGGAHLGVIKQLEALHIPVDIITGTSIGSFVGGLYASGLRPDEIEQILLTTDWNEGYRDDPNRAEKPLRRRRQADLYASHFRVGVDLDGIKLPTGLIQGQSLSFMLERALGHHPVLQSFDQLPISYRAVAADLQSGTAVVFERGSLVEAMQASMAIPGVVSPPMHNDRLVVDGGIANNLPIDVAKSLGATRIIAVEIPAAEKSQAELASAITALEHLTDLLIRKNVDYQKSLLDPAQDLLLSPDVSAVGMLDFDLMDAAIAAGEQHANAMQAQLSRFSLTPAHYAHYRQQRNPADRQSPVIDEIRLVNNSRLNDSVITALFDFAEGDRYDADTIQHSLNRVYSLGTFERVSHHLRNEDGHTLLLIEAEEKSWGPGYLDFRFEMADDFKYHNDFEVQLAYTLTNLSDLGGEWRSVAKLGTQKGFQTELYWPILRPDLFVSAAVELKRETLVLTSEGESLGDLVYTDTMPVLSLGWNPDPNSEIRIGWDYAEGNVRLPAVMQLVYQKAFLDYRRHGGFVALEYDRLDNVVFPRQGWRLNVDLANPYDELDGVSGQAQTFSTVFNGAYSLGNHTLATTLKWQSHYDDFNEVSLTNFQLGGLFNLSGYPSNELFGQHVRFAGLFYRYRLLSNQFGAVSLPLYLGFSAEAGNAWQKQGQVDYQQLIYAGSIYVGWDSPLGPLILAYANTDVGFDSFYLTVGKLF